MSRNLLDFSINLNDYYKLRQNYIKADLKSFKFFIFKANSLSEIKYIYIEYKKIEHKKNSFESTYVQS